MRKTTLIFIAFFVQLFILVTLSYFWGIRLYINADILQSYRTNWIPPPQKSFNTFGSSTVSHLNTSKTHTPSVQNFFVFGTDRKSKKYLSSKLPYSNGKKITKSAFNWKSNSSAPVKTKHFDIKNHTKKTVVTLSQDDGSIFQAATNLFHLENSSKRLLYSDLIKKPKNVKDVDLLIMVLTAASKFQRRSNIRKTWWKDCYGKTKVACWFFTDRLESITDAKTVNDIQKEQEIYKDIIFTPINNGIAFGFRFLYLIQWAAKTYNFSYAMRIDDDVMLCVDHLLWDLPHFPRHNVHYGWLNCREMGIVHIDEGIVMFSNDIVAKFLAQDGQKMLCHPFGDQQIAIWEQEIGLNQTELIRMDNRRIHHSPPASYDKHFKNINNICDHYIAIHGLYQNDMLDLWSRRGNENTDNYTTYSETDISKFCPYAPYLNWTVMGGMYRQEPKPCLENPIWNLEGIKIYNGRERQIV